MFAEDKPEEKGDPRKSEWFVEFTAEELKAVTTLLRESPVTGKVKDVIVLMRPVESALKKMIDVLERVS